MKSITLILGGARSGKSRYALNLASEFKRVTFIATARASDVEMRRKIDAHRAERPPSWRTVEVPRELPDALRKEGRKSDVLLIDCLTVYLANILGSKDGSAQRFRGHLQEICEALQVAEASTIVVSNEVGSGIVPAYRSGRIYRDLLGQFNQEIARIADRVIFMVAGLPLTIKDVRNS
ncbi:MAG: bifunctional adenosylcobinamide kinase/adenosylcobinamide-phosphate guanylyltransferase [Acidobacteriota bacterium]|nr:bifunctional adenosylcobinamide kinase/adenosylcobinamide-phosphate guanylyltransferase [Acidobacteriota bacterium]